MAHIEKTICPNCGRALKTDSTGNIGYCSYHKLWFPVTSGSEPIAAAQNAREDEIAKHSQLEREKADQERMAQEKKEQHEAAVRKAVWIAVAVLLIILCIVFFVVRPSIVYSNANKKVEAGEYAAACDIYDSLDGYKDSEMRVILCTVILDLHEGRTEEAGSKIEKLYSEKTVSDNAFFSDTLLTVLDNWNTSGLSPQAILVMLDKKPLFDPTNKVDAAHIEYRVHLSLLNSTILASYTKDINEDGKLELITLDADYKVTTYQMLSTGNFQAASDNSTTSACYTDFGKQLELTNLDGAVICYENAYKLSPTNATSAALTAAYHLRSIAFENTNNYSAAIMDAEKALSIAGTPDAFSFYYSMNLRHCKNGQDYATSIAMWEAFAEAADLKIRKFGAAEQWKTDAGLLHLAYAAELAMRREKACLSELRIASILGIDVNDAIDNAILHFSTGKTKIELQLFAISITNDNEERQQTLIDAMKSDVRTTITSWKEYQIAPAEIPAIIKLADEQRVGISDIARDTIYEEAALAAAGQATNSVFVNWDTDNYKELLTVNTNGTLTLYGIGEVWQVISSIETGLNNPSFAIIDEETPVILVLSQNNDALLSVTCKDNQLSVLFREPLVSMYQRENNNISFSVPLDGSIARYKEYEYLANGIDSKPECVGVEWQKNDYPTPTTAYDALLRYFEARIYKLYEEAGLLIASTESAPFTIEALEQLPFPENFDSLKIMPYHTTDERVLFEVEYNSDNRNIRTWIAVVYENGWKVAGSARSYGANLDASQVDYSIPLLSTNAEKADVISVKGGKQTYRIQLPSSGTIQLLWQAGDKAVARTAYTVSLYRQSITNNSIITYELQPNPSRQLAYPIPVTGGVYYITVEAKTDDAMPYSMTIQVNELAHVETENNDIAANATPIELDTAYTGNLLTRDDVDYYRFTLNQTAAINATLKSTGDGGKSTVYTLTIWNADSGIVLTNITVAGNVPSAATGNLYLSQGDYLLKISKGASWTNQLYDLTVSTSTSGSMEAESNDTIENATVISTNTDVHASIGKEGDIDCYSFTLTGDAVVQPRFTFLPTTSSSKTYVLTIMDSNRQELQKVSIGGKESSKIIPPLALPAGTYTVRVENPLFIRQEYVLHVACQAAERSELESNDTAANATALALGQQTTGVLTTQEDVDYYRITFDPQSIATLHFTFPQSTSKAKLFTVAIEQNGKTLWSESVTGESGVISRQMQFAAGEYYVKVKPSTWSGTVYTILFQ